MTASNRSYAKVTISLALRDSHGEYRKDAPAYEVARGLAVHNGIQYRNGDWLPGWTITQIASGRRVAGPFRTRSLAATAARRIARLADFRQPYNGEGTWGSPGIGEKVHGIYRRVTGRRSADEFAGILKEIA